MTHEAAPELSGRLTLWLILATVRVVLLVGGFRWPRARSSPVPHSAAGAGSGGVAVGDGTGTPIRGCPPGSGQGGQGAGTGT